MTFVVTENCIKCKYMDCVEVCPVDCFREGPNFLVIDPDECIDCTLCEPECPVEAIFSEEELPSGQEPFKQLNAELAKQWPAITEKGPAPADAKEWEDKPDKLKLLRALSRSRIAASRCCCASSRDQRRGRQVAPDHGAIGRHDTRACPRARWPCRARIHAPPGVAARLGVERLTQLGACQRRLAVRRSTTPARPCARIRYSDRCAERKCSAPAPQAGCSRRSDGAVRGSTRSRHP